jgi:STE24 endopeptidase
MLPDQQEKFGENINLDPQRQDQAKQYARIQRRFMFLDLVLGAALLITWLLTGWSIQLRNWITAWTTNPWLAVLMYGAVFGGVFTLLNLPLSYYVGYVLPHRFQQSTQDLKSWVIDLIKGLLVSAILGGLVLEAIYFLLRSAPGSWWLWAAGFLLLFNVILSNLAPVVLFPIFYKFTPLAEEDQALGERLMVLAERAGAPVMGVFRFDMSRRTKSANAGLTGLGNTRRIILGDTLLDEFTPDEIETILAHELGHHVNRDIPLGIIVGTGVTLGGLYLTSQVLNWGVNAFGYQSVSDLAALPLFAICLGFYSLLTSPLSNGFSRWRERLADSYALRLTGAGTTYASALKRLSNQNLADVDPPAWVEFFLHSHPALNKRIQQAEKYPSIETKVKS